MRLHPARPRGIPLLALTALALTTVGLAAPATAAPLATTPEVTADDVCTADPSTRPVDVYELTAVEDAGVGIWAGGGLTVTTATELEGRVVVGGDADLSGVGSLNVGTAGGGGSAITPAGGTDMLVVGGDLATATNTQVGFHASSGGNVVVGGKITGATPSTESRNAPGRPGTVTQGVGRDAALRPYVALPGLVTGLAADAADGAVAAAPEAGVLTVEAGARYTLTADQASTLTTLYVTGTGPVLLTVTGASVDVSRLEHVEYGGVRVYQAAQHLSAHFLWKLPGRDPGDARHERPVPRDRRRPAHGRDPHRRDLDQRAHPVERRRLLHRWRRDRAPQLPVRRPVRVDAVRRGAQARAVAGGPEPGRGRDHAADDRGDPVHGGAGRAHGGGDPGRRDPGGQP